MTEPTRNTLIFKALTCYLFSNECDEPAELDELLKEYAEKTRFDFFERTSE